MKLSTILLSTILGSMPAFAEDVVQSDTTTVDHSKNPITGTKTTTVKRKHKHKHNGHMVESTKTTKTKVETDGDVKKEVKMEENTTH